MHWFLQVTIETTTYILKAERIFINCQIEQIKITGEGVSFILENNRPLLENIGLNRAIKWKVIKGKLKDSANLERIINALDQSLKSGNHNYDLLL